jgi:flagella basal body P-ring formation protein FlgA
MLLFLWFSSQGRMVLMEEIKQMVTQYIHAAGPPSADEVVVEFRSVPVDISVSREKYELRVATDGLPVLRGNVSLPVEVVCGGATEKRFVVSVKIRRFGNVLFAAKQLSRHAQVGEEDILVQKAETTTLPADILRQPGQLQGKRTSRIVSNGSVICGSMLEAPPLVTPEDRVNLIVRTKSVTVSVDAVAKEDGRLGEIVTVERRGVRGRLKAKVVNEKTVVLVLD